MKKISFLILFVWFCFNPPAAQAEISGFLHGTIRVSDNRNLAFITAVTGNGFPGIVPVRRVVVAVTAVGADSGGELHVINQTFFAVTDNNGNFASRWRDQTRNAFPARLRVTVMWEASNGAGGGTRHPTTLFRIARVAAREISSQTVFFRDVNVANPNLGVLNAAANDETAAYLTTDEFFRRIVQDSNVLRRRMPGLVVRTRVPGFNSFFGVTPFPREVFISEGAPVAMPLMLAHELGHAITWSALRLNSAPINPATDYSHPAGGPGWDRITREFSKAAFLEGFADAWALVWAFGPNVHPVFVRGGNTFRVEKGRVIGPGGAVVLDCKLIDSAHEFPFCHTVALRDLLDDATGDGVDLTTANLVDTLNRFSDGVGNGQRDELGVDALNHHDFRCNAEGAARRAAIRGVWSGNGINGGPASFCPQ